MIVSSPLSGSSEQLGQPTDHSGESEPFGGSRILNLKVRPSGQSRKGSDGRCPTKGIDLREKARKGRIEKDW